MNQPSTFWQNADEWDDQTSSEEPLIEFEKQKTRLEKIIAFMQSIKLSDKTSEKDHNSIEIEENLNNNQPEGQNEFQNNSTRTSKPTRITKQIVSTIDSILTKAFLNVELCDVSQTNKGLTYKMMFEIKIKENQCNLCFQPEHRLYKCSYFLTTSVEERTEIVRERKFCEKCLKNHKNKTCKLKNCPFCGEAHNKLLCHPNERLQSLFLNSTN